MNSKTKCSNIWNWTKDLPPQPPPILKPPRFMIPLITHHQATHFSLNHPYKSFKFYNHTMGGAETTEKSLIYWWLSCWCQKTALFLFCFRYVYTACQIVISGCGAPVRYRASPKSIIIVIISILLLTTDSPPLLVVPEAEKPERTSVAFQWENTFSAGGRYEFANCIRQKFDSLLCSRGWLTYGNGDRGMLELTTTTVTLNGN